MVEQTYHKVLSTIVNELLRHLLAVLTPHVRLNKQLHWARLTSKRRSLSWKKLINNKLIQRYISFKLILPSVSHVQQTKRSRRCALSPSHELADSGCQDRTVSVVWIAQTSRAQDSAAIYLPGCTSVWNPSKPPRRSSLGDHYLSWCFLPFFVLHTKNHATYFHSEKLDFQT
jgi:hypothetical protein